MGTTNDFGTWVCGTDRCVGADMMLRVSVSSQDIAWMLATGWKIRCDQHGKCTDDEGNFTVEKPYCSDVEIRR
jgi:hypothetical protein